MRTKVRLMQIDKATGNVLLSITGTRLSTHEKFTVGDCTNGGLVEYHQIRLENGKDVEIPSAKFSIAKDGVLEYRRTV